MHGLAVPRHVESCWTGDPTCVPLNWQRILIHFAAGEVTQIFVEHLLCACVPGIGLGWVGDSGGHPWVSWLPHSSVMASKGQALTIKEVWVQAPNPCHPSLWDWR